MIYFLVLYGALLVTIRQEKSSVGDVVDDDGLVVGRRRQQRTLGVERHGPHHVSVVGERVHALALGSVPHLDRLVGRSGGEILGVWAEGDRQHPRRVARHHVDELGLFNVVNVDVHVVRRGQ